MLYIQNHLCSNVKSYVILTYIPHNLVLCLTPKTLNEITQLPYPMQCQKNPNLVLKHSIFNPKWYTINPMPYIENPECYNIHPKPYTLNHKPLNNNTKSCYTSNCSILKDSTINQDRKLNNNIAMWYNFHPM